MIFFYTLYPLASYDMTVLICINKALINIEILLLGISFDEFGNVSYNHNFCALPQLYLDPPKFIP